METSQPLLRGGCSCGRNRYAIAIPSAAINQAEVIFSGNQDHRQCALSYLFVSLGLNGSSRLTRIVGRAQGVPLTAWLRVPLTWFQSQTYSYYPDETHTTIRRTFTPLNAPHVQRNFCGYCGTPLTFWTESPREEADFMSVSLGSLSGDDLRLLEDLELLPEDVADEAFGDQAGLDATTEQAPISSSAGASRLVPTTSSSGAPSAVASSAIRPDVTYRQGTLAGVPWFEEMIEGSRLGRIMRSRRGIGISDDNTTTFEWEISEWHGDTDTGREPTGVFTSIRSGSGKRKADDVTH